MNIDLNNILDYLTKGFVWFVTSPIELVGIVILIALGYFVRLIPKFPSNWIPFTVVSLGILIYAFCLSPSRAPQVSIDPRLWMGLTGLVCGIIAKVIHAKLLSGWLDPLILTKDGKNTKTLRKPKNYKHVLKPGDDVE